MEEAAKIKRVLKLIDFFTQDFRSIDECAEYLQVNRRTISRYLLLLAKVGFVVEKRKRLFKITPEGSGAKEASDFSKKSDKNLLPNRRYNEIVELLDSPFFTKKPFIIAIYGEYNPNNASNFAHKVRADKNLKFNAKELKIIKTVFENIRTQLDIILS